MSQLAFTIDVRDSARRQISVALEVDRSVLSTGSGAADEFEFFLPVWTPGSYLVREYARHLGDAAARAADSDLPLTCTKSGKNRLTVNCPPDVQRIRLDYTVYAHELSVRTSDLTAEHAYWNHACVLLWPVDRKELAARIAVRKPAAWSLACSLPSEQQDATTVFLSAANHDEAIDAPCLCGSLTRHEFRVRGVEHTVVLDGLEPIRPPAEFLDDVKRVVETAADVFGGTLPYPRYLFQCLFTDAGHGGLEHAECTTLLASRTALTPGKSYKEFLGLIAHEHFHVWNVKRMRPEEFWSYDYERENHTPMLWLAEGWTAYYDDLICRRSQVITVEDYLAVIARNLTNLWSGAGRLRQSLSDSSYDAWIRLYRPDENTRNSTQNYYGNGAMAAMVLDLTIRRATHGARSLDDVVRQLYQETFGEGRGYRRGDVERCLSTAAGQDMRPLLAGLVDGPLDPDVEPLLAAFGVQLVRRDRERPFLGVAFEAGKTVLHSVTDGGPAWHAGVAPGDELLAIDGLRVTGANWAEVVQAVGKIGEPMRMLLASRGVVVERTVTPTEPPVGTLSLRLVDEVPEEVRSLRRGWLGAEA